MADTTIPDIARKYLQRLASLGIAVERGVIFCSYARGEASTWSDIDLLVVSPQHDSPRTHEDLNLLWRIAAREDSRIEPIPCGSKEWREDETSAIIEVARREGTELIP